MSALTPASSCCGQAVYPIFNFLKYLCRILILILGKPKRAAYSALASGSCKAPQSRNTYLFRPFLVMSSPFHPCAADCDGQENGQNTHTLFGEGYDFPAWAGPGFGDALGVRIG